MTSGQSLAAFGGAVLAGAISGRALGSRWAALAAPVIFAAVFEAVRLPARGPTVDALRFDGVYAFLTMAAGRGFDGLVMLVPMAVAALWGAALARRALQRRDPLAHRAGRALVLRRASLVLGTAAVALLVAALARPATTEPIVDASGRELPGSVAELITVPIGGHDQGLMIRGVDRTAPVLLFLEGGPGGTAVGAMRYGGQALEESFVVATWDQRGTGRSADQREPEETLTLAQLVSDTVEVTEYLVDRFDTEGVYLVGSSWGSTLGVLAVQQRPDLYLAYVGVGQMVDQFETDTLMYQDTLAYAQRVGATDLVADLLAVGPPPYADALTSAKVLTANPEWQTYAVGEGHDSRSAYPVSLFVAEFSLTEQVRSAAGLVDTFDWVYPQLEDVDLRLQVPELEVPVHLVIGEHEAPGRADLARAWAAELRAPEVEVQTWDRSGHTPHLDEPARFAELMAGVAARTG